MSGVAVANPVKVAIRGKGPRGRLIRIAVRYWSSGMYFVRLKAANGDVGFAPFVLRPHRLGLRRAPVVLATHTWQARNLRDVDGDGIGDSWLVDPEVTEVDLRRPYLNRGVPSSFQRQERDFLRWLHRSGRRADFITDHDLARLVNGDRMAALYDLVVFPGSTRYVTQRAFRLVERFRDLGGNLAFLAAGNFVYRVERRGPRLVLRGRFRDLGAPEAQLVGVQQLDPETSVATPNAYVVTPVGASSPLFAETGLNEGDRFGRVGLEGRSAFLHGALPTRRGPASL